MKACKSHRNNHLIAFSTERCHSRFSFANGEQSTVKERLIIHLKNPKHPTGWVSTSVDILDKGRVPILFSVEQMRNLRMSIEHTPMGEFLTCSSFGMNRTALAVSTSNHPILDIMQLAQCGSKPAHSFVAEAKEVLYCPACAGKHRPHTYTGDCKRATESGSKPPKKPEKSKGQKKQLDDPDRKLGTLGTSSAPSEPSAPSKPVSKRHTKKKPSDSSEPKLKPIAEVPNPDVSVDKKQDPSDDVSDVYTPTHAGDRPESEPEFQPDADEPPMKEQKNEIKREDERKEVSQEEKVLEKKEPQPKKNLPLALQRIHKKLSSPVELLKLHLKHYHMSTEQFRKRTSALKIPEEIYLRYDQLIKQCDTCETQKMTPTRAKVSGIRSEIFGELTFIDHGEVAIDEKHKLTFLIVFDGATTLMTAYPVKDKTEPETISHLLDYFETYQLNPKYIVGDAGFMGTDLESFYNRKGIRPISLGPNTPWPNRAEAAVRMFKKQLRLMLQGVKNDPVLMDVTYRQLFRQACLAKNVMVTFGGVSPLEMAFGRRPADIVSPETMDASQLTADTPVPEKKSEALRLLAMKSYLEARQSEDLRRDISAKLQFSDGPFFAGDKVFYWTEDKSKVKSDGKISGKWLKAKVVAIDGSMITIDLGTRIIKVNVSKVRKDHAPLEDVDVPLEPVALAANAVTTAVQSEAVTTAEDANTVTTVHGNARIDADPANKIMQQDADQLGPEGTSYSSFVWQPVMHGKIDFLELFSGSARLSQVAAMNGLRVGQPIDLRTGFDLLTPDGRRKTMDILEKQKPTVVTMAPTCAPWSIINNINDPKTTEAQRAKYLPVVEFCVQVAMYQIRHGRHFIMENPATSAMWYQRCFVRLLLENQVSWGTLDMCAFGMKDPYGYYYYKPTSLLHSFGEALEPVFKRCPNKLGGATNSDKRKHHIHQQLEGNAPGYGSRTKLAQIYPYRFCSTLIRSMLAIGNLSALHSFQTTLLSDLLEDCSTQELQDLAQETTALAAREFVHFGSFAATTTIPVKNFSLRRTMNVINSMAGSSEYHPFAVEMQSEIAQLREYFIPTLGFENAMIMRGTLKSLCVRFRQTSGVVLLWRKKDVSKMYILRNPSVDFSTLIPSQWSCVFYWNTDGSGPAAGPHEDMIHENSAPPIHPPGLDPSDPQYPGNPDVPMGQGSPALPSPSPASLPVPSQTQSELSPHNTLAPVNPDASVIQNTIVPPHIPDSPMNHPIKRPLGTPSSSPTQNPPATKARPSTQIPASSSTSSQPSNHLGGDVSFPPASSSTSTSQPSPKPPEDTAEDSEEDDDNQQPASGTPILPTQDDQSDDEYHSQDEDDSDDTVDYHDLFIEDDVHWSMLTQEQKICSNTGSFTVPRLIDNTPIDVSAVPSSSKVFTTEAVTTAGQRNVRKKCYADIVEDYKISEDDSAFLTLYQSTEKFAHLVGKKRKEATQQEKRQMAKQFLEAKKAECKSWFDNDVFELVDMRKLKIRNFVSGRWVLTIKRDKDGNFLKCKARWVLKGFQDKQKDSQQTDSPAASRSGFRCVAQQAAIAGWDLYHMDLKTAFLQGETYDESRDIICQIPAECGYPPHIGAKMKKSAYGLNDAPRRWWQVVDKALLSYGLIPTRADRCTYILYSDHTKGKYHKNESQPEEQPITMKEAIEKLMDPVVRNNAQGRRPHGFICLHVDDLFMGGDSTFEKKVIDRIRKDFSVGSEDKNDIMFVGQRIKWKKHDKHGAYISVDQKLAVDAVEEIKLEKHLKDNVACTPQMHTAYRSVLGQLNWLQSRTQVHMCYRFSRCASAASSPTIGDVRELNKAVRTLKCQYVDARFWPLRGPHRIIGMPDASYRNNSDKSSQRAHVIFIAEERKTGKSRLNGSEHQVSTRGSVVDYESHKITTTTQSTTVAELNALMKCFGTCLFMRALWVDVSGDILPIHIRTDANNLVTTAQTTHLPEQKETHHLIQMLRHESNTGQLEDLAHIASEYCLADPLTKSTAKPDQLVKSIETGILEQVDNHPPFRTLLKHKAFVVEWMMDHINEPHKAMTFFGEDISSEVFAMFYQN